MNALRTALLSLAHVALGAALVAQVPVPIQTDEGTFLVLSEGRFEQLERKAPTRVLAMEGQVVYTDDQGRLKVFLSEGRKLQLLRSAPVDELQHAGQRVVWRAADSLYTLREGRVSLLATQVSRYEVADSLVVVEDRELQQLNVLWRGSVIPIADIMQGAERPQWRTGTNTVTFFDKTSRKLFLFQGGRVQVLTDSTDVGIVATGGGLTGYWDDRSDRFMVREGNASHVASELRPVSVKAGDGILGFVDGIGALRCWQDGRIHTVTRTMPTEYWVQDSLLMFLLEGRLQLFHPEGNIVVEPYVPERWLVSGGSLVFLNINRELYAIHDGRRSRVGSESAVPTFDIFGDAVRYPSPAGTWTVIRKGRSFIY